MPPELVPRDKQTVVLTRIGAGFRISPVTDHGSVSAEGTEELSEDATHHLATDLPGAALYHTEWSLVTGQWSPCTEFL